MTDNDKLRDELTELRVSLAALEAIGVEREKAVNAALVAADKAVVAALTAAKEAVTKAEAASEKRFDSVNEFRQTLSDQATQFLPRKEYDVGHSDITRQITELRDGMATLRTSVAVGPAGLAPLESRAARQDGRQEQVVQGRVNTAQVVSVIFGALGTLIGIGGFAIALILATR